jgi:hypothetical protein
MTRVPNIDFTRSPRDLLFSSMPKVMCPQESAEQIPFPRQNKKADSQKGLRHGATRGSLTKDFELCSDQHSQNTIPEARRSCCQRPVSRLIGNYVMQTKKALVNVLRATDAFQMSQTGSGDLGLRPADPVVLAFLR